MKGLIKPKCPSLSARQKEGLRSFIDSEISSVENEFDLHIKQLHLRKFIFALECSSLITPGERVFWLRYLEEKLEKKSAPKGEEGI